MPKDATQVRTADCQSKFWVGPVGTVRPVGPTTAFGAGWVDMGYLTDAPDLKRDLSANDIEGWNACDPLRTIIEKNDAELTVVLAQTNSANWELYFGLGTWAAVTGGREFTPTAGVVEKALAIEVNDGTNVLRLGWHRAGVSDIGKLNLDKADAITYEVTFKRLAPATGPSWWAQSNIVGL